MIGRKFRSPRGRLDEGVFTLLSIGRAVFKSDSQMSRNRKLACLLCMLLAAAAPGCVTYSDGRPVGAGFAEYLASFVEPSSPACGCGSVACARQCEGDACPSCGDSVFENENYRCAETPADGIDSIHEPCADAACNRPQCVKLRAACLLPRDTFASTANFCIRPIAYAPAELPPPGRFHPVPTQPVFAPRYLAPSGL